MAGSLMTPLGMDMFGLGLVSSEPRGIVLGIITIAGTYKAPARSTLIDFCCIGGGGQTTYSDTLGQTGRWGGLGAISYHSASIRPGDVVVLSGATAGGSYNVASGNGTLVAATAAVATINGNVVCQAGAGADNGVGGALNTCIGNGFKAAGVSTVPYTYGESAGPNGQYGPQPIGFTASGNPNNYGKSNGSGLLLLVLYGS